ncbi:BTAD domain-containing putative transcriptional regulator [Dactylosporangium sp. NPDC051541]|uniref:AfsR/SARP family transcriptional regulator n=1 Tax=Dactylosporangium sp. NPDC051541 TaxID=3363977 RepID=UPI003791501E
MAAPRFGVLGPLEVAIADRPADIGGPRPRMLLALLLSTGGREVPFHRIVEVLWGADPPPTALGTVHSHLARLRRALEPDRPPRSPARLLLRVGGGYAIRPAPGSFDAERFTALAVAGREHVAAGRHAQGLAALEAGLAWWRGSAYADFPDVPFAMQAARPLEERRVQALVDRAAAQVGLGRHDAAVAELTGLAHEHPARERVWQLLAVALHRSGRQVEALDTLRSARTALTTRFGVDPGPELAALETAMLRREPLPTPPHRIVNETPFANDETPLPGRPVTFQDRSPATVAPDERQTGTPFANDETTLLGRLAAFEGGFPATAVSDDCLVERLAARGIITERPGPRWSMSQSLRRYISTSQNPQERADATRRHRGWVRGLAVTAATDLRTDAADACLRRLHAERTNIRAALRGSLEDGDGTAAVDIAGGVAWYWFHHGATAEGSAWLAAALAAPGQDRSPTGRAARARAHLGLAALRSIAGDVPGAVARARAAVAAAEQAGHDYLRADALCCLSFVAAAAGDEPFAAEAAARARRTAERGAWPDLRAEAAMVAGHAAYLAGDLPTAAAVLADAHRLARECGYGWVAIVAGWLGVEVALYRSRPDEARPAALALTGALADAPVLSSWLVTNLSLARALTLTGDGEAGALLWGAVTGIGRRVGLAAQHIGRANPHHNDHGAPSHRHAAAFVRGLELDRTEANALTAALTT